MANAPLLAMVVGSLLVGPLLSWAWPAGRAWRAFLDGLSLALVGGLCLLHLAPHALAEGGLPALAAGAVGFLGPALAHRSPGPGRGAWLALGAVAVLVEGWVRDVPDLEAAGLPVYASGRRVSGPDGHAQVRAVNGPVTIGGVVVLGGDVVVADPTGCVCLAADSADEVLDAARRYAQAEEQVVRALREGELLSSAYRHKKSVVDQLRQEVGAKG